MSPTKYTAELEYDAKFGPWPWFVRVYANGAPIGKLECAITRKGALRIARRVVVRHARMSSEVFPLKEVIEL